MPYSTRISFRANAQVYPRAAEATTLIVPASQPLVTPAIYATPTFGEVALKLFAQIGPGFRSAQHREQWITSLQKHAAALWERPVSDIDTDAVMDVLVPIWAKYPETSGRVRGRIERVLDAAIARNIRPGPNPARWKGHLQVLLPRRNAERGNFAAMPWADVPAFIADLRARRGVGPRMLEFTILTAARSGEVRGALRSEFADDLWTIPGKRMKGGKPHRVPLVGRAQEIAREQLAQNGSHLFTRPPAEGSYSQVIMIGLLWRMDVGDYTVHGFRSSFSDWARDNTDFPEETVEQCLAHVVGNAVRRAYRRGDGLDKRRQLMQAWDAHCLSAIAAKSRKRRWLGGCPSHAHRRV